MPSRRGRANALNSPLTTIFLLASIERNPIFVLRLPNTPAIRSAANRTAVVDPSDQLAQASACAVGSDGLFVGKSEAEQKMDILAPTAVDVDAHGGDCLAASDACRS